jgi:NADP-reducing hydrogenase subunit HndB
MAKLRIEDLKKIKDRVREGTSLREGGTTVRITVHMGTCGIASGAREVMNALMDELALTERRDIAVTTSGCLGLCSEEPLVTVEVLARDPIRYHYIDKNKMRQIFRRHVLDGEIQEEFALARGTEHDATPAV